MAKFEITAPDGSIYEIEGDNEQGALEALQQHLGGTGAQQPQQQPEVSANPDGTYGQPPEGVVLNPSTGQMEDLRSPANPNIPQGRANALGLGVGQGAGFNLLDEAAAGLTVPFGGDYDYNLARMREAERRASSEHPVSYYGGNVVGALGTGIGLAKGGLSASNAAVNAGYRLPATALISGAEGAALGVGYGFGAGEGGGDRLDGATTGAAIGGATGFAMPFLVSGLSKAYQKARTPFATSPERAAAVRTLESEGIPLTAGQKTGSRGLRYAESELGGGRAADLMEDQARAFTDAAMRKAGGSGLADPEALSAMKTRLSKGFDTIAARNTLTADGEYLTDMLKTLQKYNRELPSEQKKILGNIVSDIGERIRGNGGKMSGADYQSIRSNLTKKAHNARVNNADLADAYRGMRDALDNVMERSIRLSDTGVWGELRRQYGNSKVLMNAANGAGEAAGQGYISPARLRMAASGANREGFALGNSDFSQLAKAGQTIMTPLPDSGTASRLATRALINVPAGIGAIAGGASGDIMTGLLGAAIGGSVPKVAGKALMSKPVQNYLANQAALTPVSGQMRGLLNALFNSQAGSAAGRLASP